MRYIFLLLISSVHINIGICQKFSYADSIATDSYIEEIIIAATRTERQLSSLPMPSQIISKEEIENINSIRLDEVLNEQTGLIMVSDIGGSEGIQVQGLDAEYTLILIDGVPIIGRTSGNLDLKRISVNNIKQIEIVKGASSSLYGTQALGGVINIVTEKRKKENHYARINYRYGTFNSHDANINLGYKKKRFNTDLSINRYSSNGYDLVKGDVFKTVDPFLNYTFTAKSAYQISKKTNLILYGRYYLQDQEYITSVDIKGETKLREWNIRGKFDHQINDKLIAYLDIYSSGYKTEEHLNDITQNRTDQVLFLPEFRTTYNVNENHSFFSGIGWRYESLERDLFYKNPVFNSQYVYFQYDGRLIDKRLNVIVGARFDRHNEYSSQFSPKLAARYQITSKIAIKGSIGYGFKAPDFRQLYLNFTQSTAGYTVLGYDVVLSRIPELQSQSLLTNIKVPLSEFKENSLKPESSIGINLGIQYWITSNFSLDINFFRNDIKNLIENREIAAGIGGLVFSYYNIDRVYTTGLELNGEYRVSENIKLAMGYQLLYAKDKNVEKLLSNGKAFYKDVNLRTIQLRKNEYFGLFNRSRHMINLKGFFNIPKWKLATNIRITYRSKYGRSDTNSNAYLDKYDDFVKGYFIIDWAISKILYKGYKVSFGIDNLLNFRDPQNIPNIPGRIMYGKLILNIF